MSIGIKVQCKRRRERDRLIDRELPFFFIAKQTSSIISFLLDPISKQRLRSETFKVNILIY